MPIIIVRGCWDLSDDAKREMTMALKTAVVRLKALELSTPNAVTVFFPPDVCFGEIKPLIVAEVVGLYENPERTFSVIVELASLVGYAIKRQNHEAKVEVFVSTIPCSRCWSSE